MSDAKTVGRLLGALLVVQAAALILVHGVLLPPAIAVPPGFLANAAASSAQVTVAVLLLLVTGALQVGIAITAFPVFRRHSHAMALWFLALGVVTLSAVAVEAIGLRSMLSLSQEYATANAADAGLFQAPAALARSVRNGAHYTYLLVTGGWLFVLYGVLFRFALVPRALAAFGLVAEVLLITGAIVLLSGQGAVTLLIMPNGLSYLALTPWLMAKGFEERDHPFRDEAPVAELPRA